jgi:hypothetical protein
MATEPTSVYISHASREIKIAGDNRKSLITRWGNPKIKLKKNFRPLKYGQPDVLPKFDEQWIYFLKETIGHRFVYLRNGVIVLCIEEWTDF